MFLLSIFTIRRFLISLINYLTCFHSLFLTHVQFMIQLFLIINLHLSRIINFDFIFFYFDFFFFWDERYNDYRFVNWRILLNNVDNIFQLNFFLSEIYFRNIYIINNLIFRRIWNVDDLIFYVRNLIICREKFKLIYCAFFLQRITKSSKITINEYKMHKKK